MQIYQGNLDYTVDWALPHILLFTGNPVKKTNGAIVMGAGAAKMVRDTYMGIDKKFGDLVSPVKNLIFVNIYGEKYIGWFKVKKHWQENADLEILARSVYELKVLAESRPELTFHMNYPAVGNGKLSREVVEPYLLSLPDNVWLYLAA